MSEGNSSGGGRFQPYEDGNNTQQPGYSNSRFDGNQYQNQYQGGPNRGRGGYNNQYQNRGGFQQGGQYGHYNNPVFQNQGGYNRGGYRGGYQQRGRGGYPNRGGYQNRGGGNDYYNNNFRTNQRGYSNNDDVDNFREENLGPGGPDTGNRFDPMGPPLPDQGQNYDNYGGPGPNMHLRHPMHMNRGSAFSQAFQDRGPGPMGGGHAQGDSRPNSLLFGIEPEGSNKDNPVTYCPDDEEGVRETCMRFGEIRSIRRLGQEWMVVTFYDPKPAEDAFQELNGYPWKAVGQGTIRIKLSRPNQHRGGYNPMENRQHYGMGGRAMGMGQRQPMNIHPDYKKPNRAPIGPTCSIWVAYEVQAPGGGTFTEALGNDELMDLFGKFGEVFSMKQDVRRLFSFINYTTVEAATDAFEAYMRREIIHRPDCKLKIKWGHPPPNHPLAMEINRLEDERYAKREQYQAVTGPSNNLFDRVQMARAKEQEQQRRKVHSTKDTPSVDTSTAPPPTLKELTEEENDAADGKPKKKKAVTISIGSSKPKTPPKKPEEVQAAEKEKAEKEKQRLAALAASKQQEHKADAFAAKVIELLNNVKEANWREFISELTRQKLDVKENKAVFFDILVLGAIVEGPETLYFPQSVKANCNVFQSELPEFISQTKTEDKSNVWLKTRTDIENRYPMSQYVELWVQIRRRLRYLALSLETSLVRYLKLSPALPELVRDMLAAFIGLLLQSPIGTHGSTDLVVPLSPLLESRLTENYNSARIFATILKSFKGKERDLAKVLRKAKLTTPESMLELMPPKNRNMVDFIRYFKSHGLALENIFHDDGMTNELAAAEKKAAIAFSQELYKNLAEAIKTEDEEKAVQAVESNMNDIGEMFGSNKVSMNKYLDYPIVATIKAFVEPCAGLSGDQIESYVEKWIKLLSKCGTNHSGIDGDEVPESRQRLMLDSIYILCANPATEGSESNAAVSTQAKEDVQTIISHFGGLLPTETANQLAEKLVLILHPLYDSEEDILGEETILKWFAEVVKKGDETISKRVAPLIDWLQEAEEESEEEED